MPGQSALPMIDSIPPSAPASGQGSGLRSQSLPGDGLSPAFGQAPQPKAGPRALLRPAPGAPERDIRECAMELDWNDPRNSRRDGVSRWDLAECLQAPLLSVFDQSNLFRLLRQGKRPGQEGEAGIQ